MSAADHGARPGPPSGQVQQGLKEALVETLTAILSPVQEVRAAAEEQIKVLEVTEGECGGGAAEAAPQFDLLFDAVARWLAGPVLSLINQPGVRGPCAGKDSVAGQLLFCVVVVVVPVANTLHN